jgi:hypothetical protein
MVQANADSNAVFLVYWMSYDEDGNCWEGFERDDCCLIGVYDTRSNAEAAVARAKTLPGFRLYPDAFLIDKYAVNKDHWTTGFVIEAPDGSVES